MKVNKFDYDMQSTVRNSLNSVDYLIKHKNIKVRNTINTSLIINHDTNIIERVIVNLLGWVWLFVKWQQKHMAEKLK